VVFLGPNHKRFSLDHRKRIKDIISQLIIQKQGNTITRQTITSLHH
jgi:hypothetical protein